MVIGGSFGKKVPTVDDGDRLVSRLWKASSEWLRGLRGSDCKDSQQPVIAATMMGFKVHVVEGIDVDLGMKMLL